MITRSVARSNKRSNVRNITGSNTYFCTCCHATESVQWRKSSFGERLCNKCGVRSQRLAAANTKKLDMEFTADGDGVKRLHPRVRVPPIHRPQPRKRPRKQSAPKRADFE